MRKIRFATVLLAVATMLTGAAGATTVLGQLALNEARIDGATAPAGTTITSPSRVQTGDQPSVIHLATGGQLYLGPNSSARLAAGESGGIEIAADAGQVQFGDDQGEVMTLAHNSLALVDQDGDVEIDPDQRVCVLESPGKNTYEDCAADHALKGCDWEESTAGELDEGDVYFVPADEDEECSEGGVPVWVWGVGGSAAALVLYEELDDDNDEASPFQPN